MHCKFSIDKCEPECKKFSLCSLQYQQEKILEIQEQISVLSKTIGVVANTVQKNQNDLDDKLNNYTAEILSLINK